MTSSLVIVICTYDLTEIYNRWTTKTNTHTTRQRTKQQTNRQMIDVPHHNHHTVYFAILTYTTILTHIYALQPRAKQEVSLAYFTISSYQPCLPYILDFLSADEQAQSGSLAISQGLLDSLTHSFCAVFVFAAAAAGTDHLFEAAGLLLLVFRAGDSVFQRGSHPLPMSRRGGMA